MADRTARVLLTADSAGLEAGMARAAAATDASATAMGEAMDGASTRIGGATTKIGAALSSLGIPGAEAFGKIGSKISEADTKGQKFGQTMSTLGGVTLAAGAVGLLAVGAASVEMADKFDTAQTEVQNAVKNSGESFTAVKPSIDATYSSLSNLGFNATESATALSGLIIATGNTSTAEKDLAIAADLARAKHISLSAAAAIVTKTIAGSTRALTSLGINLDIGSGKLKTIATDTTAYNTAQTNLTNAHTAYNETIDKTPAAYAKLQAATTTADAAQQKLALDQGTISTILDTVKEKTDGAATAYGQTLAGQMDIARAKAENLGIQFGEFLIPKIIDAEHAVEGLIGWFEKHKTVAEALAITVGTVLAGAVAVFTVNTAVGMVGAVQSALTSIGLLSAGEDVTATATDTLAAAVTALEVQIAALATPTEAAVTAQDAVNIAWAQAETLSDTLDASITELTAAYVGLDAASEGSVVGIEASGAAAATSAGEMDAAGAAAGEEGLAGGLAAGGEAAGGLAAGLGPLAIGIGVVGAAAYGLNKAFGPNTAALDNMSKAAENMATTSIPDLTLKLGALQHAQETATEAIRKGGSGAFDAGLQYESLKNATIDTRTEQTNLNNNLNILSTSFGISKSQAQSLATELGVNLGQALSPAQAKAFSQQIQQSGLDMDTAGGKAANMGSNTVAALSSIGASLGTTVSSTNWAQLGTDIDTGVANGITSSSGVVVNAASGMVQQVISASRTGLKAASPSKVFMELGTWVGQGFAQGIDSTASLATASTQKMIAGAVGVGAPGSGVTPTYAATGSSGGPSSTVGGGQTQLILQIDSTTFATGLLPALVSVGAQYQRTTTMPVFGNVR